MIEVINLTKLCRKTPVIDNLSMKLYNGHLYGLLGKPDAGKTALLDLLSGVTLPTDGQIRINGFDLSRRPLQAKSTLGYLPQFPSLYPELTPRELLEFVADTKQLGDLRALRQIREAMELTQIEAVQNTPIARLSPALCRRVALALTLIGNPDLLLLDDPFADADKKETALLCEILRHLREKKTVVVASRNPDELESLCDHFLLLDGGRLILQASAEELGDESIAVTTDEGECPLPQYLTALKEAALAAHTPAPAAKPTPAYDGEYELIDESED